MGQPETLDTEAKLRERVKELECLYKTVHLATKLPDMPLDTVLQGIAELLPPAWRYPEIASGRIVLDDQSYKTKGFALAPLRQSAEIVVRSQRRGFIEVVYSEERPTLYEGSFLREERNLIEALAREVSGIVERHQVRLEKAEIEDQLRHADRLATLGQLAAGVVHELNDPLGNILGFAQLALKAEGLPVSVAEDLTKIVDACLYSREIINKLRLFARRMPTQRKETDLNEIITERLFFIESRYVKNGIEIVRQLHPRLPHIVADPSQLHQILINLMVNAVQAMPDGGVLTICTEADDHCVVLTISDTGIGIDEKNLEKVFLPFFTTKDVDEGTGLGLSVVDNIVKAHNGTISVRSRPCKGTAFEVRLPIESHPPSPRSGG